VSGGGEVGGVGEVGEVGEVGLRAGTSVRVHDLLSPLFQNLILGLQTTHGRSVRVHAAHVRRSPRRGCAPSARHAPGLSVRMK